MPSSIIDSEFFGDMFGTEPMRAIFSDRGRIEACLKCEAALARAEARVGLIPSEAAEGIAAAAKFENLDLAVMKRDYEEIGFPILPLVRQLAKACDSESARWVHWGATTQDIVDTGLVLQMREGLALIERELDGVIAAVAELARRHRDTVMPGRTFQQHAAPITFGYKAAVWLDELLRHRDRLPDLRRRSLVCSYGGAVGTLSTLGKDGISVLQALSSELDLEEPPISWHTARDGWAELIFTLGMIGTTLGKIGNEVSTLMRTEVDEVREPYVQGKGGSSTMPQKRNPTSCPILIAIAHRLRDAVGPMLESMMQEHERGVASQPTEWLVIPEVFVLLSGSLKHARSVLEGLEVDAERMRANLDIGGGFLMAESVMMGLAPKIGRQEAHELVSKVARGGREAGQTLRESLLDDVQIMKHLTEKDVDRLLDPSNYLGCAGEMIDRVLAKARGEPQMNADGHG